MKTFRLLAILLLLAPFLSRAAVLPKQEKSPHPMSSISTSTTLGRGRAAAPVNPGACAGR